MKDKNRMTKKWKCGYCGLETRGYGVYSHQQACQGYLDKSQAKLDNRRLERQAALKSAMSSGAVESALLLIESASMQGLITPSRKMRSEFESQWNVAFEVIVENSEIGSVPKCYENNRVG